MSNQSVLAVTDETFEAAVLASQLPVLTVERLGVVSIPTLAVLA